MNSDVMQYIINLMVIIPVMCILVVISLKLGKSNIEKMSMNKYTKVLEKTILSKDTDIYILKIGDEGCVIVSSSSNTTKIKDLTQDEIIQIESDKNKSSLKKSRSMSKNNKKSFKTMMRNN